jgi:transcriptional regulator with XRE-family HTH domain
MEDVQIGRIVRARRRRLGWRQVDLALRVGCHQTTISRLERGHLASLSYRLIRRIAAALEIRVELMASWRGGELDRLLDERHAEVVDAVVAHVVGAGWSAMPEVTYSEYGERGSIDILAVHGATRSAAVFEIKVDLSSVEGTLRKHAEKTRLAPGIVFRECGWRPRSIARILVVPENQTARRVLAAHQATFRSAYPADSRTIRRWLRDRNGGAISGIWFLSVKHRRLGSRGRGGPSRVRAPGRSPV